jgi:DHA1 family inner membrane transport protein
VTSHFEITAGVTVFVWGVVFFTLIQPLQLRVIECASDAPNLASTLNQGAFNLGNALGAWIGGAALTLGFGYDRLPVVGAVLAALALGVALASRRVGKRRQALAAA